MAQLRICRAHQLETAELRRRVESLAAKLVARYGGAYRWQGDLMRYQRSGDIDAEIHCSASELRLEVVLGPLASFLRGTIERELHSALDRHLQVSAKD